jgi:hypothetical protein
MVLFERAMIELSSLTASVTLIIVSKSLRNSGMAVVHTSAGWASSSS